jgi:DNA-binding transcriptional LysR family regulator
VHFDDVRTFVAVAEARSVSRAARDLHLTQPAVTRRVQRLETSLGVTLCDRRRRPFTLTAAGRAALERCRRVLRAVRDVHTAADNGAPPGEIRIGVAHALTELTLTEPIDRLRRSFPRVALALATGWSRDLLERVRAGALDAAVILLPAAERLPAGLDAVAVGRERLVVVEPRRTGRARARGLAGLDGTGWVLNPDGCAARAMLERALHGARVRMRVAVETYTYELQLALVARGRGLGLVPARVLARSRLRSRLRVRRVPGLDFPLTIWSVRRGGDSELAPVLGALDHALGVRLSRPRDRT